MVRIEEMNYGRRKERQGKDNYEWKELNRHERKKEEERKEVEKEMNECGEKEDSKK